MPNLIIEMLSQIDQPVISDDPLYLMIREKRIEEFNNQRSESCDFSGLDFRGVDLRGIHTDNINFSGCYFFGSDLRGLDLSNCQLQGASIHNAHIAGVLFPNQLSATEIQLSHQEGTRMRYTEA